MRKYDLTERGKIIIAVILVTLIFVIPAIILAAKAWNSSPPPEDPPKTEVPADPPPVISNTPLPEGSGVDPNYPQQPGNGEQGSFDPPVEPPDEPDPFGPVDIDVSAGTMSFLYSPDLQNTLDADTISMLGEFITSPQNTADSQINVELPQLSGEEASELITAITDAFTQHNVAQDDIKYVVSSSVPEDNIFEIFLSFTQITNSK